MPGLGANRWDGHLVVVVLALAAVVVLPPGSGASPLGSFSPRSSSGILGAGSAPGLVGYSTVQTVSGTPYFDTFCPYSVCVDPVGVTSIGTSGPVVLTEYNSTGPGPPSGPNAVVEFSPTTLVQTERLNLSCEPGIPYYPGTGYEFFVPCGNATALSLLEMNSFTDRIVGRTILPFFPTAAAYDSRSGVLFVGGSTYYSSNNFSATLAAVDPVTGRLIRLDVMPNASFQPISLLQEGALVYDPIADRLLVPSNSTGMLSVIPTTSGVDRVIPTDGSIIAIAIDAKTDQLFVSTDTTAPILESGELQVFDAGSFALRSTIPLSNCSDSGCFSGDATEILVDDSHGDAYLTSAVALDALNLSSLAIVGSVGDNGDGFQVSAVYLSSPDRIFGTYQDLDQVQPGFMIQLQHSSYQLLSEILGLPEELGILVFGIATGLLLSGIIVWRGLESTPKQPE